MRTAPDLLQRYRAGREKCFFGEYREDFKRAEDAAAENFQRRLIPAPFCCLRSVCAFAGAKGYRLPSSSATFALLFTYAG